LGVNKQINVSRHLRGMSLFIQGDRGQRGGMGEAGPKGEQVTIITTEVFVN